MDIALYTEGIGGTDALLLDRLLTHWYSSVLLLGSRPNSVKNARRFARYASVFHPSVVFMLGLSLGIMGVNIGTGLPWLTLGFVMSPT